MSGVKEQVALIRVSGVSAVFLFFLNTAAIPGPVISSDTSVQPDKNTLAPDTLGPEKQNLNISVNGNIFHDNSNRIENGTWSQFSVRDMLNDQGDDNQINRQTRLPGTDKLPGTDILEASQQVNAGFKQPSVMGKLAISHGLLLRESESLRTLGELLAPANDTETDNYYSNSSAYQETGGSNGPRLHNQLTLQDFAVDILGPRATDLEIIHSSLKDLRNYIMVTQPKTSDLIIRDSGTGQPIIYESDSKRIVKQAAKQEKQKQKSLRLAPVYSGMPGVKPVIEYFSLTSLWGFLTAPVTIMFYGLCLICWATWRYIIRKYV